MIRITSVILMSLSIASTQAAADEIGRAEYQASCGGCHGREGAGNGPISENLNLGAPDLTRISVRNGGEFPFETILRTIDGRDGARLHGSSMPIWGDTFLSEAPSEEAAQQRELTVRGRLLSLVYYLQQIQEK